MALLNRSEAAAVHAFRFKIHGSVEAKRAMLRKRLFALAQERPEKVERFAEFDPALDDETSKLLTELLYSLRKIRTN